MAMASVVWILWGEKLASSLYKSQMEVGGLLLTVDGE